MQTVNQAPLARQHVVGKENMATVQVHSRVTEAAKIMRYERVGCLIVVNGDSDEMAGIITERDVLDWVASATPASFTATVADVMATEVITCNPDTPLADARRTMVEHGIRHLPIVENGVAIGIISSRDAMGE